MSVRKIDVASDFNYSANDSPKFREVKGRIGRDFRVRNYDSRGTNGCVYGFRSSKRADEPDNAN